MEVELVKSMAMHMTYRLHNDAAFMQEVGSERFHHAGHIQKRRMLFRSPSRLEYTTLTRDISVLSVGEVVVRTIRTAVACHQLKVWIYLPAVKPQQQLAR